MNENFIDDYDHADQNVFYTCENVPGPGIDSDVFQNMLCMKCVCTDQCSDSCSCVSRTGKNYSADGRLLYEKLSVFSHGIIECNYLCKCNRNCGNRLVQYGPTSGLDIFYHDIKGYSLKTIKKVHKGEFICEYAGEIISKDEAKLRVKRCSNTMNYIFVLKEHSGDSVTETIVDPTSIGNIGRYINHSCQPNSVIVPVRFDSVIPHLAVFAVCDITPGEEITFDYSGGNQTDFVNGKTPCCCGSSECRKFIPFNPDIL